MSSTILDLHQKLIEQKIKIVNLIDDSEKKHNHTIRNNDAITTTYEQAKQQAMELQQYVKQQKNNLLFGIPYSLKDNITTFNIKTTGGSKFLENYVPPFNASIYESLIKANAILIAKANCDEFGMGGTGLYSAYGQVHNHYDFNRIVGGSSSGGANQVASDVVAFSISTDTGDSIRRPASFVGVVGYKPTSGLISRYGVFPYAPSLDCVGINAKSVIDSAIVAQHVVEFDNKDFTSQKINDHHFFNNIKEIKNIRINVIKDIHIYLDKEVREEYQCALNILRTHGHHIKEMNVTIEVLATIAPTYATISYSEGSSCYANLTGINFGINDGGKTYEEMILHNRTKGIGKEVIKRLCIGELLTNKENFKSIFTRAKQVRTLLVSTYKELLKEADCFLLPGASSIAPLITDVLNKKFSTSYADDTLILANFAGAPSITIPYTKVNKMPFGLNINCHQFEDQKLFNIAYSLEKIFNDGGKHE